MTKEVSPKYSSLIESMAYDYDNRTLTIEFKTSDRKYRYYEVSHQRFSNLMKAKSKGAYFSRSIKGKYKMRRLPVK